MDILEKGKELAKKIPHEYYVPVFLGCIGLILFVYGAVVMIVHNQSRENLPQTDFSQTTANQDSGSNSAQSNFNTIIVDVEGAVVKPGVYHIAISGRVADALIASGGLSSEADRQFVAEHINLAAKLTDGGKIYIPHVGEANVQAVAGASDSIISNDNSQVIDINSASLESLDSLPGIGQVTAQKIISGRPYASIQDLVGKKIVGQKEFEKIQNLIVAE